MDMVSAYDLVVTILVFLAALVQPKRRELFEIEKEKVTILVFLAALVQLTHRRSGKTHSDGSYNPCFSGSSSATKHNY